MKFKTAEELKQYFLDEAGPLVEQYVDAALGRGELKSTNASARAEVWELLKALMLQSSEKMDIDIDKPEDILKAIETGKCSIEQGKALLGMYKQLADINNPGASGGASGGPQIVVNIQGAETQPMEAIDLGAGKPLKKLEE